MMRAREMVSASAIAPDHCLDCYRLIRPGQRFYQGSGGTALCPTCHGRLLIGEEYRTLTTTSGLVVDYDGGLIRIRRDGAAIVVKPQEVSLLAGALGAGANQALPASCQDPETEGATTRARLAMRGSELVK